MEYEEVAAPAIRWAPAEVGEYLEGTFKGAVETDGQFGPYMRYFVAVNDTMYWVSGASLGEAYRLLKRRHQQPGTPWKIECVYIDDVTMVGRRIAHYRVHAG